MQPAQGPVKFLVLVKRVGRGRTKFARIWIDTSVEKEITLTTSSGGTNRSHGRQTKSTVGNEWSAARFVASYARRVFKCGYTEVASCADRESLEALQKAIQGELAGRAIPGRRERPLAVHAFNRKVDSYIAAVRSGASADQQAEVIPGISFEDYLNRLQGA